MDIDLQIQAMLHRNYIYEDAFDKLSPDNEANLRLKMRVQLVNAAGRERIYLQDVNKNSMGSLRSGRSWH